MLAEVKKMKKVFLLASLVVPLVAFNSQAPAPSGFEHWRPADLQAASKALAEKAASDPHHAATKTLSDYPNDLFLLAHREADGKSSCTKRRRICSWWSQARRR